MLKRHAVGGVEELIGGNAQVGEDDVDHRKAGGFEDFIELREVGFEETNRRRDGVEAFTGEFEISRVAIETKKCVGRCKPAGEKQ